MGIILYLKLQFYLCFSDLIITVSTAEANILEDKISTRVPAPGQSLEEDWDTTPASATTGGRRARARPAGGTASATTSTTTTTGQCQAFRTTSTETRRLITDQQAVGVITCNFVNCI